MTKTPKVAKDKSSIISELPLACADEDSAVAFLERQRWGSEAACPRCGDMDVKQVIGKDGTRGPRYLWRCRGCKRQFTVRIGTIFGDSKIPLRHWCFAFWAACSSKKGVSALQIKRQTGLSYKSALFLMHRVRYAMTPDPAPTNPLTGVVEVDETYVGGKPRMRSLATRKRLREATGNKSRRMPRRRNPKTPVVAMLERGGDVRAMVCPSVTAVNVRELLLSTVSTNARLMTDESPLYTKAGRPYADHQSVKHSIWEYARGEAHTNGVESFFSRLKRQLYGTHHAVSPKHLHRYVAEVAFKHNTRHLEDGERTLAAIEGGEGKRLRRG